MIILDNKQAALIMMVVEKLVDAHDDMASLNLCKDGIEASDIEAAFAALAECGWDSPIYADDLQAAVSQRIPECDLVVCFVGHGTHFHATRLVAGEPGDRPICGSGPKGTEVRVPWDHTGNAYEDAWGEYAVDCPKCLRWMYPEGAQCERPR